MLFEKASASFWLNGFCVPAGLQGALLSHFLEGPVPLSEVVIGRKFAEPRCALALGVEFSPEEGARCRVVETTVRLEHSKGNDAGERSHEMGRGTHGDGDECITWAQGDRAVGRHDGRTGCALSPPGGQSEVCRAQLLGLFRRACGQCSGRGDWLRLDEALVQVTQGEAGPEAYGAIKAQANAAGGWHGELRQSWMRRRGLS